MKLKTTNPNVRQETKKVLEKLYWRIFEAVVVTNNDFGMWLVKGYIWQEMG
jgi:hypothetical protein